MLAEDINKWFISPDGSNSNYSEKFLRLICSQLVQDRADCARAELIPDIPLDRSLVNDMKRSHSIEDILERLSFIYRGSMNASSPGYIGQMDSIPNLGGIAGELVTAVINNNMLAHEMSPLLSELETEVLKIFASWFGLGEESGGLLMSGGTLSNIQALNIARNIKLDLTEGCLVGLRKPPVLFASKHCHTSIDKAAMLLGIGAKNVVKINTDDAGRMKVDLLKAEIISALRAGSLPFAVVSTYGTTNAGALDQVDQIQEICEEFDLWHHIDAVYGGAVVLSSNMKAIWPDFHKADSLSFNPQKWMYISKTCSMLLLRKFDTSIASFKVTAPYVKKGQHVNLGELGIQGSRHTSVLKLWMSLFLIGKKGYEGLIDHNMHITRTFVSFIRSQDKLELYTDPELNIILFRTRDMEDNGQTATSTLNLHTYLKMRKIYISPIQWEGSLWLKCIFLNPFFSFNHLSVLEGYIKEYIAKI